MCPTWVTKDGALITVVKFLNELWYQSVIFLYVIVLLYSSYLRCFLCLIKLCPVDSLFVYQMHTQDWAQSAFIRKDLFCSI